jgi:hypothetical protein
MKTLLLFCCVVSVLAGCAQKQIKLSYTFIQPYCGGARPSPEMLEEARKKRPYANRTLIYISESGKTDSAKTNAKGELKVKLKPGTYKFYEAWRYYKKTPDGAPIEDYFEGCLDNYWSKELTSVSIIKKTVKISHHYELAEICYRLHQCIKNRIPPE